MNSLTERKKSILVSVVKEYVKTARPVSSKQLKRSAGFTFSSATLRNAMADLEDSGYLTHPHTSAGRLPTAKGYRLYVDTISKNLSLGLDKRRYIMDFFSKSDRLEELLKKTCHFISQITPYLGIVTKYSYKTLGLKHIDLVPLSNNKLLIVLITKTGDILREKIAVTRYDYELQKLEQILNKELAGLELQAIKQKCEHLKTLSLFGTLFDEISGALIGLFEQGQASLFYDGIANLLSLPEFAKVSNFFRILNFVEEELNLNKISTQLPSNYTYIAIGDELKSASINEASLILVPYRQDKEVVGSVGVIGPMRMDYEQAIATTECIASNLSLTLQKMA